MRGRRRLGRNAVLSKQQSRLPLLPRSGVCGDQKRCGNQFWSPIT